MVSFGASYLPVELVPFSKARPATQLRTLMGSACVPLTLAPHSKPILLPALFASLRTLNAKRMIRAKFSYRKCLASRGHRRAHSCKAPTSLDVCKAPRGCPCRMSQPFSSLSPSRLRRVNDAPGRSVDSPVAALPARRSPLSSPNVRNGDS